MLENELDVPFDEAVRLTNDQPPCLESVQIGIKLINGRHPVEYAAPE